MPMNRNSGSNLRPGRFKPGRIWQAHSWLAARTTSSRTSRNISRSASITSSSICASGSTNGSCASTCSAKRLCRSCANTHNRPAPRQAAKAMAPHLQIAGQARLVLVVLPGLADAIGVLVEARPQDFDFFRRDRLERAERRGIDDAAHVLFHFQAVEKGFRNRMAGDDIAVPAQQTVFPPTERGGHGGALFKRA